MKRITNKQLQTALLRGAVVVSGLLCTGTAMLFCDNIYSLASALILGCGLTALIDEVISNPNKHEKED